MSDKAVQIAYGEKVFTIDFVRTTPFRKGCKIYKGESAPHPALSTFDEHRLRSGPYDVLHRQSELAKEVEDIKRQTNSYVAVLFTALAAVIAALSVIAARPVTPSDGVLLDRWPLTALVASVSAIVVAVAAWVRAGRAQKGSN